MMKYFYLMLVLLVSIGINAQKEIKQITKSIPVKKISKLEGIFDNKFYYFEAKSDTGIWDVSNQEVLLHSVRSYKFSDINSNWLIYETKNNYGLFNATEHKTMISSTDPFFLSYKTDSNLIRVVGKSVIGYIDLDRNANCVAPRGHDPGISFFEEEFPGRHSFYDSINGAVVYGYEEYDGVIDETYIQYMMDYVVDDGEFYNAETGEFILNLGTSVEIAHDHFVVGGHYNGSDYYNSDLELVYSEIRPKDMDAEMLQYFGIEEATDIEYFGSDDVLLCSLGDEYLFVGTRSFETLSPRYDNVFDLGRDYYAEIGFTFFTLKDDKLGLFRSYGEELSPQYKLVEELAFSDGSFAYRADDSLYFIQAYGEEEISPRLWKSEDAMKSVVIRHASIVGDKLIISPRRLKADNHDSGSYTSSWFEDGAGVYDLTSNRWKDRNDYHTLMPYGDFYIGMEIGSIYKNASWLHTTIWNKDMSSTVTDKELGVSFIYKGKLVVRERLTRSYIIYDPTTKRVEKRTGEYNEINGDFEYHDDYLFIGSFNYQGHGEYYNPRDGFDISDIMTPDFQLINFGKDIEVMKYINDGLIIVTKMKEKYDRRRYENRMFPDTYAIYDLYNRKVISRWVNRIFITYSGDSIYFSAEGYDFEDDYEAQEIKLEDIRKRVTY